MVVLINTFDVEAAHVETFLSVWKQVSAVMERRPGFRRTRLHRALAGARFVNVAEWENQGAFADAIAAPEFHEAARPLAGLATMSPALYDVVHEA
jgi:heme-degrading monooxygenase HmoA